MFKVDYKKSKLLHFLDIIIILFIDFRYITTTHKRIIEIYYI